MAAFLLSNGETFTVCFREVFCCFRVVNKCLSFRIPLDRTFQFNGNISEIAGGTRAVTNFYRNYRVNIRFYSINEVLVVWNTCFVFSLLNFSFWRHQTFVGCMVKLSQTSIQPLSPQNFIPSVCCSSKGSFVTTTPLSYLKVRNFVS